MHQKLNILYQETYFKQQSTYKITKIKKGTKITFYIKNIFMLKLFN